jgi:hypothetical protein
MCEDEEAIRAGWARLAETWEPRPLNWKEKAQLERLHLEDKLAKKASFVLGEPING